MRGSIILATAVLVIWTVVYVITQLMVTPALPVLPTAGIGVALTIAVVLGYPSALRGPRGARASRANRINSRPTHSRNERPDHGVRDLAVRAIPLRSGLTQDAARRTCELLRPMLAGDAVFITDTENILAYIGPGQDHHRPGGVMQTSAAPRAVRKKKTVVVRDKAGVGCRDESCEVLSAVIAPLRIGQRVVGTLGVYQATTAIPPKQMVEDMAKMLSLHL
ncbi:GAF domain-containing protein, partial [Nesterenkonia haasae]|uniref:GAF domain-containing protein n=1 Tax=Nesterenkonia haasae TaxID=2587813 RepID=UPI00192EE900